MIGRQDALFEVELADKSRNVLDVLQESVICLAALY